jgi:hypothetical protein
MGQAKRRRERLGLLYPTVDLSDHPFVCYEGLEQSELDKEALQEIKKAKAIGRSLVLVGTKDARALAAAADLPWLHELPEGAPLPRWYAWDPEIAEAGGPMPDPTAYPGGLLIMGAGSSRLRFMMTKALAEVGL